MARKKRILFVNEFSQLATGFSTYGNEVMKRLYATGKYEIAEQASYCSPEDPRIDDVPWKVYPTMPARGDTNGWNQYNGDRAAQFGSQKFFNTLVDFKPDIVFNLTDPWMSEFIPTHPLRRYFKFWYMPTIDGEPQRKDWWFLYRNADILTTYSNWAHHLLINNGLSSLGPTPPGADHIMFAPPENKRKHKESLGLNPDWFIIQTVMRNQNRKFYPELFESFVKYLEICKEQGKKELATNTYLHIHTSTQDVGWNLAAEIQKYKLSHKILFTYIDHSNNQSYLSFYKGSTNTWSKISPSKSAHTPNTSVGITRDQLANIMKCADLYVEYSCCEGFGMGKMDAKSCGVPVMGLPYSATAEQVLPENGGIPLKIAAWHQEGIHETSQKRAKPDNDYTAKALYKFFNDFQVCRDELGKKARQCILDGYTWDGLAKKWENILDSIDVPDQSETWYSPPRFFQPQLQNVPWHLPDKIFIQWCYEFVVGSPNLLTFNAEQQILQQLSNGQKVISDQNGQRAVPFNKQTLVQELLQLCEQMNQYEQLRYNIINHNPAAQPQLQFASV